jgi:hypothetical protein
MFKLTAYIIISFISGAVAMMLLNKIVTLLEIKQTVDKVIQGLIERFDRMMTGNDGCYSSTRAQELLWACVSLILISIAVLKKIVIQEGILVLIGAAIGVGGIKGAVNKAQEIKQEINSKG